VAAAATAAALLAAGFSTGGGPADGGADDGAPNPAVSSAADSASTSAATSVMVRSAPDPAASGHDGAGAQTQPSASPTVTVPANPDLGAPPQTHVLPGDRDPQFQAGAQALRRAIVLDKPELARPFLFPLSAYQQVDSAWNPADDYRNRLPAWYGLDIRAAHDHLGANAAKAQFVGVQVPEQNAEWIQPGVEYNKGSYYRVYGARLNYQIDGRDASIGVFSLVSWRGEWYVVHLGPSTRAADTGIVYDPRGRG
jgi:hypothetical protein